MAYYVSNWQDIKIRVHIIADEGTDIATLPTHFCPGSIATVIGDKVYHLSASYEWEEAPSQGGGGASSFDDLTDKPKYNGVEITSETDIPEVMAKATDSEITERAEQKVITPSNLPFAVKSAMTSTADEAWTSTEQASGRARMNAEQAMITASALPSDNILVDHTEYDLGTISALTISGFADGTTGFDTEYAVVFTAGSGITVSVPNTVKWAVAIPVFEATKMYYLSFKKVGTIFLGVWSVI